MLWQVESSAYPRSIFWLRGTSMISCISHPLHWRQLRPFDAKFEIRMPACHSLSGSHPLNTSLPLAHFVGIREGTRTGGQVENPGPDLVSQSIPIATTRVYRDCLLIRWRPCRTRAGRNPGETKAKTVSPR